MIKKARLPKSTKISGVKWRVIAKRNVIHPDGESVEGVCHYDHRLIEVCVETNDEVHILQNYYHEIFHALIHESGVELSDNEEHSLIRQFEKFFAANVDWRERPRKQKNTKPTSTASQLTQLAAKRKKGG